MQSREAAQAVSEAIQQILGWYFQCDRDAVQSCEPFTLAIDSKLPDKKH